MAIKQKDIFKLLLQRNISEKDENIILNYVTKKPDFLNNINNEYHLNPLFLATLHNEALAKKIIPLCKKEHFINKVGLTFLHMIAGNRNLKDYQYFLHFYHSENYLKDEDINNNLNPEHVTPLIYAINNYNYRGAKAIFNLIKEKFPMIQQDYSLLFSTQKEDLYLYYSYSKDKANHLYFLNKHIFSLSYYIKNYQYNSTFFRNIGTNFYTGSNNNVSPILNHIYSNIDSIPNISTLKNNDHEVFINALTFSLIKFNGNLKALDQYLLWLTKNNQQIKNQINFYVNDIIDNQFTSDIQNNKQFNEYISIIIKHIGIKPFINNLPDSISVQKPLYLELIKNLIEHNIKIETYDDSYIQHILCNNAISDIQKQKFYESNKNVLLKEDNFGYHLCQQVLENSIKYNSLLKNILSEFLNINRLDLNNKYYINFLILPDYYLNSLPKNDDFNQKIIDSFFCSSKRHFLIPLQIEHIQNYLKFISDNNITIDFKNINQFRHKNDTALEKNIISLIEKHIIEKDIFGNKLTIKNKKRL